MQNKKVSVIVPVYNMEKYLSRCVDSILAQTYSNLEVILVDDGSKDSSPAICDKYAERDSRVKVVHKANGGPGSARNLGIEESTGDYIAFVDSDDTIKNNMYERMLKLVIDNCADMVCSNIYDDVQRDAITQVMSREEALRNRLLGKNISDSTVDKLYTRKLFSTLRFPIDRNISEDTAIVYQLISVSNRIVYTNEKFYNITRTDNSLSRSKYDGRCIAIIDTYEEMVDFFKSTKEPEFEKIAIAKANNAVLYNVGEYCVAKCVDKEFKKRIKYRANYQLKTYKNSTKSKILLLMTICCFGLLGLLYKCKKRK